MAATALPVIDIVYRRGKFTFADSQQTATFFLWFGLSLAFWSAQAIYSRAFYAAGDTLTPMIATTVITIAVLPVYKVLFHTVGIAGLAIASDIGILVNTVAFAFLLHSRGLVPARFLRWRELGKALLTGAFAGFVSYRVAALVTVDGSLIRNIERLGLASLTWGAAVAVGLWTLKSDLPQTFRRKRAAVATSPIAPQP
jgi:putative peptidoglycan lipid II flippase